ncbi:oxaloacetate decarboxylase subunit gamma [Vibrio salinus]|uniref:oxaloacetate decarboxylase subunit gamma n=1 Tax=Vibrio salinus TaxID=2899784 RepID=UPI001E439DC7|nr:oxaloacetate decarboxylase subunit gamma [Vibrio salinus]MCE0494212.1 oxaloacetate decarboxylase subunit gamma [Vibrio salinus]
MDNSVGSLLWQAANIMVTGMGVVFIFLTIMVFLVTLMSKLVPKESLPDPVPRSHTGMSTSKDVEPQVIAAISAAIHQHRTKLKKVSKRS